ncbi:MAG: phage baseplate assembly protein V [Candidatus Margulisiibacteriota bacterium]
MSLDFAVSELTRRLANLIRVGIVSQIDVENARVKIVTSQIETDWLPWLTSRAGDDTSWWAPSIDEQVLILSPSGELSTGVVLPAIYSDLKPANADTSQVHRITYSDGTVIEYDKEQNKLKVDCVGSVDVIAAGDVHVETEANVSVVAEGNLTAEAASAEITAATVTINGNVTVNGTLHATGNISSDANVAAAALLSGATISAGGMSASGGAMSAGSVSASGDVTAGGISLASHVHGGVMGGPGTTGGPQ